MFNYTAYGLNISSEFYISPPSNVNRDPDVLILKKKINFPNDVNEGANFDFLTNKKGIYLFWKDIGNFTVRNGSEILVDPVSTLDPHFLSEYIRGLPMGLILNQRGYFVLHASAVNVNGIAVAFMGYSGAGKSTTATAFYKNGRSIVTDDILAVSLSGNTPKVHPGFPYIKLSNIADKFFGEEEGFKSVEEDQRYRIIPDFNSNPLPLAKIYALKWGKSLRIIKLNVQDALIQLLKHSYGTYYFAESNKGKNLKQCANVVDQVPINCLIMEKSLERLPRIVKMIEDDLYRNR